MKVTNTKEELIRTESNDYEIDNETKPPWSVFLQKDEGETQRSKPSSFPQLVPQTPTTRKAETDSNQSTTILERIPSSYRPTRYASSPLPLISQVGNGSGWLATTSLNEEVFHVGFNTKARQQATNNHLSDSLVMAGLRPRTRRKGTP
ncbi:hypothetical protein V6N11_019767 [Hibiscus sabdariffa]